MIYRGIGARQIALCALALTGAMPAAADQPVGRMPELVVTASRIAVPSREVGSAVTVVTSEDIERRQVRFVADVLRDVPGVAVSRSGPVGAFTQVRIRGAEGNHTLVLIDGVEVNDPSGGSEFDFGSMLAADIERIEILRGPQSALYGSDAIGGVVNIVTKRGRGPGTATLSAEAGSFRTGQVSASLRGAGDWFDYSLGGTGFRTDGVSVADTPGAGADGHRNQTYTAKIGAAPLPGLRIELFGRYAGAVGQSDPEPAVAGVIRTVDGNLQSRTIQRTGRAQATYSLFDGAWEHALGMGVNTLARRSLEDGAITFESDGRKTKLDYQTTLRFDTPSLAGATHSLTLLAERENEAQTTRSAFGGSDLDLTHHGYAGEYRVGLWDRLFLSGGIRHDDNEIFRDATTFRLTAAYLHDDTGTRLHGSYGTAVKNPTLFELFGFGPNFVPNPNLRPERGRGWDIGIDQSLLDDRASVDVTYFNNRITDLIQGAGNTAVNLAGTTQIQGVEVTGRLDVTSGLTIVGQYTFTDGRDASGAQLVRRAKHTASVNAHYRFLDGRASINAGARYTGPQRDFEFSNFFADRRVVTLNDYLLVNVGASYELTEGVELYGRVDNLLNQDYQDVLGFSNPGIGAYLGVRTTFRTF